VQSILPLAGGEGLLKLTTAEYLRPSGGRLHRGSHDGDDAPWGVIPDAGLECAPTRAALDRLRAWRRRSDTAISADRTTGPCAIDDVLARAVARLQDPGHDD
jgi:C-terminal processing protease CtpA/Prc